MFRKICLLTTIVAALMLAPAAFAAKGKGHGYGHITTITGTATPGSPNTTNMRLTGGIVTSTGPSGAVA